MSMTWNDGRALEATLREKLPDGWALGVGGDGLLALGWDRRLWLEVHTDGRYTVTRLTDGATWGRGCEPGEWYGFTQLVGEIVDAVSDDGVGSLLRKVRESVQTAASSVSAKCGDGPTVGVLREQMWRLEMAIGRADANPAGRPLGPPRLTFDPNLAHHHCPRCTGSATVAHIDDGATVLVCKPCRRLWPMEEAA